MIYNDDDWPFAPYFNGVQLPKWSTQWHLCSLGYYLNDFKFDDWDEFIGYRHIWQLQCRLDNVGVVESEDPLVFRICAQEVIRVLLGNSISVIRSIGKSISVADDPEVVYRSILIGAEMMVGLVAEDKFAFWINGYDGDRIKLANELERFKLPMAGREIMAPHELQRQKEQKRRIQFQISAIHELAKNVREKDVRDALLRMSV